MTDVLTKDDQETKNSATQLDAVVIGAGVAGLYQLYMLRAQGLETRAYEAGSDVGGTWYWNRYPGAKFDSEAQIYQYLFSEELYKEWTWSEKFPAQPEIESWLHFVTQKLDLRKDIQFDTTIESAHYDTARDRWILKTTGGEIIDTRFLVACCGMLSAPLTNVFPGQDSFEGELYHTARWPKEPVDFAGKRVGVVGIGATGIQVIQSIAGEVDHLKVFVRTPQYCLPMKNPRFDESDVATYHGRFEEIRERIPHTFTGFEHDFEHTWAELTPEQRRQVLEDTYQDGSLKLWLASFAEIFFDAEVSEQVSEFVREKMRARLNHDPALCDLLIPTDYGFGSKRVPLDSNYLEQYLRDNVEPVNVRDNPIERVTPNGVQTADGSFHELDVLILATGFDAGTGALTRIDIRGRDGRALREEWGRDIRTSLGLQKHGYPNLFMTGAPLAPSAALCNMTTCLQQQTEWINGCIRYARDQGFRVIEPSQAFEDRWVAHHDELADRKSVV